MAIPDFQACMLPLLRHAADGKEHPLKDAVQALAEEFKLTEDERRELLPSGNQPVFLNRVSWARTYLKKAGLLLSTRKGVFEITDEGRKVLQENPPGINIKYLKRFPDFVHFQTLRRESDNGEAETETGSSPSQTPQEALETAHEQLRSELAAELLTTLKSADPARFETIVVDLLVKMGYGGSRQDAGRAIGRSGDGGIDGIIKEDYLGLDNIYIQAKRWEAVVGRPEIQKFAGALQGQRARKGIFITTSGFTREALDFVSRIDSKIILIDGPELSRLMIDFNVGVTTAVSYEVKKLDLDYFSEG